MSFKEIVNRMLVGRNGIDDLSTPNLLLVIILFIFDLFINNIFLSLALVFLIVILFFRILSKNVRARRKENNLYLKPLNWVKKKFNLYRDIIINYNKKLYKRCPKCKQMLKLPLKKGVHTVKCPDCGNSFTVKCRRNEKVKVEVIKNSKKS